VATRVRLNDFSLEEFIEDGRLLGYDMASAAGVAKEVAACRCIGLVADIDPEAEQADLNAFASTGTDSEAAVVGFEASSADACREQDDSEIHDLFAVQHEDMNYWGMADELSLAAVAAASQRLRAAALTLTTSASFSTKTTTCTRGADRGPALWQK